MQIMIDIPEESYKATCDGCMLPLDVENVVQGIKNGVPLPDGAEILTKEAYSDLCTRAADVPDINVGKLDGDPIDIDNAIEYYSWTLEALKGIDLEVDG